MPELTGSSVRQRTVTVWMLGATAVLTAAALGVGVADNVPGIVLLYGAGLTLVLAVTHRWRASKKFGRLFLGAVVGFVLLAAVHNFAEVGAHRLAHVPVISAALTVVSVVAFLAALIVCPMTGLVGVVGGLANLRRDSDADA